MSLHCTTSWPESCQYNVSCSCSKEECDPSKASNNRGGIYCATVIKDLDELIIGNMGCMYDQEITKSCKNQTQCQLQYTTKEQQYLHCCCNKDFGNENFTS